MNESTPIIQILSIGSNMSEIGTSIVKTHGKHVCHHAQASQSTEPSCDTRKTWPYKNKYRTYPKMENTAFIPCFAKTRPNDKNIDYYVLTNNGLKTGTFICPQGYSIDMNHSMGIRLVKNNDKWDDLHLSSDDVVAGSRATVKKLLKARKERIACINANRLENKRHLQFINDRARNQKNEDKLKKLALKTTSMVMFNDAIKAGNCFPGVRAFCVRNRLPDPVENPYFAVPANDLRKMAKDKYETDRVENSIFVAFLRETTIAI